MVQKSILSFFSGKAPHGAEGSSGGAGNRRAASEDSPVKRAVKRRSRMIESESEEEEEMASDGEKNNKDLNKREKNKKTENGKSTEEEEEEKENHKSSEALKKKADGKKREEESDDEEERKEDEQEAMEEDSRREKGNEGSSNKEEKEENGPSKHSTTPAKKNSRRLPSSPGFTKDTVPPLRKTARKRMVRESDGTESRQEQVVKKIKKEDDERKTDKEDTTSPEKSEVRKKGMKKAENDKEEEEEEMEVVKKEKEGKESKAKKTTSAERPKPQAIHSFFTSLKSSAGKSKPKEKSPVKVKKKEEEKMEVEEEEEEEHFSSPQKKDRDARRKAASFISTKKREEEEEDEDEEEGTEGKKETSKAEKSPKKEGKDEEKSSGVKNKKQEKEDDSETKEKKEENKKTVINPFAPKTQGGKDPGADYDPSKTKYHPIKDAFWQRGQKMDYSKFISKTSARRKPSCISELRSAMQDPSPSLVWLASGMPNPEKFPFRSMTVTLEGGKELSLSKEALSTGLQYGPSSGYPPLLQLLKGMIKKWHDPPCWADSDMVITVGNQDGMSKALEMLLDPGDLVVVSNPCYSDVLCMLSALAPQLVAVDEDEQGMRPDLLQSALEQAVSSGSGGVPKALYVVPNSCNPSGSNMGEKRRQEIYDIARQYDLVILEDDPYFFLQFTEEHLPSFLSMDVDGRVLRFDSFSKIVSAGLRVGFVTGPSPLVRGITLHMQSGCVCPPMLSQVLILELLTSWGEEGFKQHISDICQFYKKQRDAMIHAAETHLTGICEWTVPEGGIFIWLKVLHLSDTNAMLIKRGAKGDIVLVPGNEFMADSSKPCPYMRAAYSCASPDEMMKGMENLAKLIQEEIKLQST